MTSRPAEAGPYRRDEMVTFDEISKRVGMSRQRVRQIAEKDADWPVPRAQWRRAGRSWVFEWGPIEDFFHTRKPQTGRPRKANPGE